MHIYTQSTLPFAQPGRFYRGNLHGHSTNSDGRRWSAGRVHPPISPERLRLRRADRPLHRRRTALISAIRVNSAATISPRCSALSCIRGRSSPARPWHLLAVGLPLDFETQREGDTGASVARRAMEAGAFVAATHPNWYAFTVADFETLDAADAVECYNGGCDAASDRGYSWHFIDMLLHRGHRVGAIAVDDLHAAPGSNDFMRGWVQVKAEALTPEALLRALKAGHYYSSTGPQLHNVEFLGRDKLGGRVLAGAADPGQRFESAGARRIRGGGLRGAEFDLSEVESRWLRVTVRDEAGGRAWTNPLWLE